MPDNYKKEDLRIKKTYKALIAALLTLLKSRNFGKITVFDLCEEALISRATFYTHFNDKYDLLSYWLTSIRPSISMKAMGYLVTEEAVNRFIYENSKIIRNIVKYANNEVLELLLNFFMDVIDIYVDDSDGKNHANKKALFIFCAGGMVNYLIWHVNNEFPADTRFMNSYFYDMVKTILEWDAGRE